ncbi:MAG: hypothetical protein VX084_09165, partial [Planctomycetota bacterium]|nr:hypothetical protein [Planctomycetota bacterium]
SRRPCRLARTVGDPQRGLETLFSGLRLESLRFRVGSLCKAFSQARWEALIRRWVIPPRHGMIPSVLGLREIHAD